MKKLYLGILIFSSLASCINNPITVEDLSLVSMRSISIPEISGLTTDFSSHFYAVSDRTGKFYTIDSLGNIFDSTKVIDGDFEAITFIGSEFAVADESSSEIYLFDYEGTISKTLKINTPSLSNKGIEGLVFLPQDSIFIAANEKFPVALHKIDMQGNILSSYEFFNSEDISGLWYDKNTNYLWVLSEESAKIMKCNLNYQVLKEYHIPDDKIEGICIKGNDLYMVSDNTHNFYHYKINQ